MNYPADFQKAVDDLIDNWEGTTYTETPGDAGGGTKFGISSKSYPNVDIKDLTRDQAVGIYYHDFWLKGGIDKIPPFKCGTGPDETPMTECSLPQLKAKVFNIGVLIGIFTAKSLLAGCSSLNTYKQILVKHFEAIVIKHPEDAKFLKGWERRALS
ncbi:MAG: glycosyl hydrolase 108 family protein [Syntrophobacteraceae bacterium]